MMNIGLIAHDERKEDLLSWVETHLGKLSCKTLYATGTTGGLLKKRFPELDVTCFKSGPLGGDQQMGAAISQGEIDGLVFFIDPLGTHPHDVDIKALLRLAVLYNVPSAFNRATADFLIASPLFETGYERTLKDYSIYLKRFDGSQKPK